MIVGQHEGVEPHHAPFCYLKSDLHDQVWDEAGLFRKIADAAYREALLHPYGDVAAVLAGGNLDDIAVAGEPRRVGDRRDTRRLAYDQDRRGRGVTGDCQAVGEEGRARPAARAGKRRVRYTGPRAQCGMAADGPTRPRGLQAAETARRCSRSG